MILEDYWYRQQSRKHEEIKKKLYAYKTFLNGTERKTCPHLYKRIEDKMSGLQIELNQTNGLKEDRMKNLKPMLIRLVRVLVGQAIGFIIAELANISAPWAVGLGALINSIAKYLRDTFKWEWLPV